MVPRKGDGRECCGVWQTSGSGEKAAWWQRRRAAGAAAAGAWRRRRQRRWCRVAYRDVVRVVGHVGGDPGRRVEGERVVGVLVNVCAGGALQEAGWNVAGGMLQGKGNSC